MKKLLASLMLIVISVVGAQTINALDPTQVYNTGNIVNNTTSPNTITSTWQNVGLMNQGLPCWAPGDPGCGPQPYFNNGSFNFSYGVTDVYQIANIAAALPNSGTGLRVNGYYFGFMAKNGNGWDGGGVDTLSAYVTFYGSDGKQIRNDYYDLNYQFDWTAFNLYKTFDTPYANKDLSNVRYGFVGGDTSNYWAGPYGPEIYNVGFSLNYSVDPCYNNVLSSPTCPGYMDALAKITAVPATAEPTTVSTTSTTPTSTITVETVANPTSPSVTVTSTPSATTPASTSSSSNTAAMTQPSASNKESSLSSSNLSLGLSVVAKNQQREQAIATQAVQTATSTAAAAATASQQEAASVAAQAVTNSTLSTTTMASAQQAFSGSGIRASVNLQSLSLSSAAPTMQAPIAISVISGPMINSTNQAISSQSVAVDTSIALTSNMLLDKNNPLNQIIDTAPTMPAAPQTLSGGSSVNRNASNNEAAGDVDLTKMAIAPAGYDSYLNVTLKDAAFYAPREVYKNQKNVDNARLLRQLTNDSRHREMVEQQHRR